MLTHLLALSALTLSLVEAAAVMPFEGKMRGVNLGCLFVFEVCLLSYRDANSHAECFR